MNNIYSSIIIFSFVYIINFIVYYFINKRLIKNNIDLFVKRHEQQVIHEVNNELFKKEEELIDEI